MLTAQYNFISAWLTSKAKTDRGASLVEYALLVALIAAVCVVAVRAFGQGASETFGDATTGLDPAGTP